MAKHKETGKRRKEIRRARLERTRRDKAEYFRKLGEK